MSIFTLPVFEAEFDPHARNGAAGLSDDEIYSRLEPPKTIVVKFGVQKLIGEFPYDGTAKPGCGSKLVARTFRGLEVVEMLTTTCSNSGCGKSISRHEMLDYIDNSGGKDYPFYQKGSILRVATIDDLNRQSALEGLRQECVKFAKAQVAELRLPMKLVEAEPILGGEVITFFYMSEDRVDFRDLVQRLATEFKTRIEMRQVGARDEARLVADYERCGQHCCCKNFLKVLKPVSMRAAKVQKATLDPLKISGRCGRLMCCLRYEDQTYKELKANLPPRNKRVGTVEGPGVVIDSKILVQLVLVRLEHDMKEIAVPVEELLDPNTCPKPGESKRIRDEEAAEAATPGPGVSDPLRGMTEQQVKDRVDDGRRGKSRRGGENRSKDQQQDAFRKKSQQSDAPKPPRGRGQRPVKPPIQPPASPQFGSPEAPPLDNNAADRSSLPPDQGNVPRKSRRRGGRGRGRNRGRGNGDSGNRGRGGQGPGPSEGGGGHGGTGDSTPPSPPSPGD